MPPFGADEQEDLMSIFEVTHLRSTAHFLDTQCMCFISSSSCCDSLKFYCQTVCLHKLEILSQEQSMMDSLNPGIIIQSKVSTLLLATLLMFLDKKPVKGVLIPFKFVHLNDFYLFTCAYHLI